MADRHRVDRRRTPVSHPHPGLGWDGEIGVQQPQLDGAGSPWGSEAGAACGSATVGAPCSRVARRRVPPRRPRGLRSAVSEDSVGAVSTAAGSTLVDSADPSWADPSWAAPRTAVTTGSTTASTAWATGSKTASTAWATGEGVSGSELGWTAGDGAGTGGLGRGP